MTPAPNPSPDPDAYAAQIEQWASWLGAGLSTGAEGLVLPVTALSPREEVEAFATECFDKRCDKLMAFCGMLRESPIDLRALAGEFLARKFPCPGASSRANALRFLDWIEQTRPLSLEDADRLTCDRAMLLVEQNAEQRRAEYVLFAERQEASRAIRHAPRAGDRFLIDPTGVWATFRSSLILGDAAPPPATVYFHAMDEDLQLRGVDEDGQAILTAIGESSPMEWSDLTARIPQLDRRTLAAHCRTLLEHGLIARL